MDDRDGSFDRFLKRLGIMVLIGVLIGVACFWAGRLTGRGGVEEMRIKTPPVCPVE